MFSVAQFLRRRVRVNAIGWSFCFPLFLIVLIQAFVVLDGLLHNFQFKFFLYTCPFWRIHVSFRLPLFFLGRILTFSFLFRIFSILFPLTTSCRLFGASLVFGCFWCDFLSFNDFMSIFRRTFIVSDAIFPLTTSCRFFDAFLLLDCFRCDFSPLTTSCRFSTHLYCFRCDFTPLTTSCRIFGASLLLDCSDAISLL